MDGLQVRNHGAVPQRAIDGDLTGWSLRIDGEVQRSHNFTMAELQKFPTYSRQYVQECAGNGRHGYRRVKQPTEPQGVCSASPTRVAPRSLE